jgi:hypothetical protein
VRVRIYEPGYNGRTTEIHPAGLAPTQTPQLTGSADRHNAIARNGYSFHARSARMKGQYLAIGKNPIGRIRRHEALNRTLYSAPHSHRHGSIVDGRGIKSPLPFFSKKRGSERDSPE